MKNYILLFFPCLILFVAIVFPLRIRRMGIRKAFFSSIGLGVVSAFFFAGIIYTVIYLSASRTSYVVDTLRLAPVSLNGKMYYGYARRETEHSPSISEYLLFSETRGVLSILEYRHMDIKEVVQEKKHDARLERCRYRFVGWAAHFTGRADTDFLRLCIPEDGLAVQAKNERFIILPE